MKSKTADAELEIVIIAIIGAVLLSVGVSMVFSSVGPGLIVFGGCCLWAVAR